MSVKELEQRVLALERQVKQLQESHAASSRRGRHDWEATVEKFKNDEHVLAVLGESMKAREQERKAARKRQPPARRKSP
jgi:ribosomal protein RSM22 (predicted rRNA methylase)